MSARRRAKVLPLPTPPCPWPPKAFAHLGGDLERSPATSEGSCRRCASSTWSTATPPS